MEARVWAAAQLVPDERVAGTEAAAEAPRAGIRHSRDPAQGGPVVADDGFTSEQRALVGSRGYELGGYVVRIVGLRPSL